MSLLDDLNKVQKRNPSLTEWLKSRKPDERAAFEAAVADLTVPLDSLVGIVRKHGGATTRDRIAQMREAKRDAR